MELLTPQVDTSRITAEARPDNDVMSEACSKPNPAASSSVMTPFPSSVGKFRDCDLLNLWCFKSIATIIETSDDVITGPEAKISKLRVKASSRPALKLLHPNSRKSFIVQYPLSV
jgi:hypothetical protein